MKKTFFSVIVILIVIGFFWYQNDQKDKTFMNTLLLHKPIETSNVDAVYLYENDEKIKKVSLHDSRKIIEWFNDYEPRRVSEEKVPAADSKVVIDLATEENVIINYVDKKIYISRNDVGIGVEYVLIDDAPELEDYLENLISNKN